MKKRNILTCQELPPVELKVKRETQSERKGSEISFGEKEKQNMSTYGKGDEQEKVRNVAKCRRQAIGDTTHAVIVNRLCERRTALFACQIIYCHPDPK